MTPAETLTLSACFFVPIILAVYVGFPYTGLVSLVQHYADDPVVLTQVASGK